MRRRLGSSVSLMPAARPEPSLSTKTAAPQQPPWLIMPLVGIISVRAGLTLTTTCGQKVARRAGGTRVRIFVNRVLRWRERTRHSTDVFAYEVSRMHANGGDQANSLACPQSPRQVKFTRSVGRQAKPEWRRQLSRRRPGRLASNVDCRHRYNTFLPLQHTRRLGGRAPHRVHTHLLASLLFWDPSSIFKYF